MLSQEGKENHCEEHWSPQQQHLNPPVIEWHANVALRKCWLKPFCWLKRTAPGQQQCTSRKDDCHNLPPSSSHTLHWEEGKPEKCSESLCSLPQIQWAAAHLQGGNNGCKPYPGAPSTGNKLSPLAQETPEGIPWTEHGPRKQGELPARFLTHNEGKASAN